MTCKTAGDISYFDSILLLAIQVTALFGNSLFLIGLVKFPSLRNVTNIFLCCLVTADIIVALGPMNITFAVYICGWGPRSQTGDIVDKIYLFTDVWCGTSSIWSLTVIAVDRFFAIEWPFIHQRVVKPSFAVCTIIAIWLISAANACLYLIPSVSLQAITLINIIISFAIPIAVMSYCYICIAITARKQSMRIASLNTAGDSYHTPEETGQSNRDHIDQVTGENSSGEVNEGTTTTDADSIKRDPEAMTSISNNSSLFRRRSRRAAHRKMRHEGSQFKAAQKLGIVMGAFIVAWTPFMTIVIIAYIYCGPPPTQKCFEMLNTTNSKYCKFLHYFSSALNPCLYVLLNKKWRDAFRKMLSCSKGNRLGHDSRTLAGGWQ